MFKSIVIAFAVLAVCGNSVSADISGDSKMKMMMKIFMAGKFCLDKHPLSSKEIESFKYLKFPEGEAAKCFTACLFKSIGFMDENGYYTPNKALENASKYITNKEELNQLEELFQSCFDVNNEDVGKNENGCDRSELVYVCLKTRAYEMGFIPKEAKSKATSKNQ